MPNELINALCIDADDLSACIHESGRALRDRRYCVASETKSVLERLEDLEIKATFFIPGHFLSDEASLVRSISEAGHEIASHGNRHSPVGNLSRSEFLEDVSASKKSLEDLTGREVDVYKAPIWSITPECIWAYDLLLEAGFRVDHSATPRLNEYLGHPPATPSPFLYAEELVVIPATGAEILGFTLPLRGGFYNAYTPIFLQNFVYDRINGAGFPFNIYFHPYEHSPDEHNRKVFKYHSLWVSAYAAHVGRYHSILSRIAARYRLGPLQRAYSRWLRRGP
ncbi:MAG: polysaccharide deacetylase family protein [Myxococcota bacterium]